MIIYESDIQLTQEEFEKRVKDYQKAYDFYAKNVKKGMNPETNQPYATIMPEENALIKKIVIDKIDYEFKSIEDIKKDEEAQKKALQEAEEAEKKALEAEMQKLAEEAQKKAEEEHRNKMDINHELYDHRYAREQEYYAQLDKYHGDDDDKLNNKTDAVIALREYELEHGKQGGDDLIQSIKDKWPKKT